MRLGPWSRSRWSRILWTSDLSPTETNFFVEHWAEEAEMLRNLSIQGPEQDQHCTAVTQLFQTSSSAAFHFTSQIIFMGNVCLWLKIKSRGRSWIPQSKWITKEKENQRSPSLTSFKQLTQKTELNLRQLQRKTFNFNKTTWFLMENNSHQTN